MKAMNDLSFLRMSHISLSTKDAIVALHKLSWTQRAIAKEVNATQAQVARFLKRFAETRSYDRAKGSGRPRATTPAQDKIIKKLCLKDRKKSAPELLRDFRKKTRNRVKFGRKTLNNRILAAGLPARTPRRKPLNTEVIRAKHLKFAEDHLEWTVDDWKRVCFLDETWMQIRENGRLQFVRRQPGKEYEPQCVATTTKHPTKIMVFGAIRARAKSNLILINGNVDAVKYQQVLKKADIPSFVKRG